MIGRAILVLAVILAVAAPASAQDAQKKAAAELLFKEGKRLLEAGKLDEACAKLEESQRLDPALGTLLNLALCHEKAGQIASAWNEYIEAERQARAKSDPKRQTAAQQRAAALEPRLPRLIISGASPLRGLVVTSNGQAIDPALFGVSLPVDPAPYTIVVRAPGFRSFTTQVDAIEGKTVTVAIPPLEPEQTPEAPKAPPSTPEPKAPPPTQLPPPHDAGAEIVDDAKADDPGRTRRWIGLGVGGAGIAAVGAATFLTLSAKSDYDDAFTKGLCNRDTNRCNEAGLGITSDARSQANLATIIGGVGLAAIAGGAVLYFTAPNAESGRSAWVVPMLTGESMGVAFGGAL